MTIRTVMDYYDRRLECCDHIGALEPHNGYVRCRDCHCTWVDTAELPANYSAEPHYRVVVQEVSNQETRPDGEA